MADDKQRKRLPENTVERLRSLIKDLESKEGMERDLLGGEFELKINADEALWYVAYKTKEA